MTATCRTPGCPERGIDKTMTITLGPDDQVLCGACGQPCELSEPPQATPKAAPNA